VIRLTAHARIDGDQLERVLRIAEMKDAELTVEFRVDYRGAEVTMATRAELMKFLESLRPPGPLPAGGE
jgi:hypothetical protein